MDERFTVVTIQVDPIMPWRDVLIAELMELGFDSFEETAEGCKGYILSQHFDENAVRETTAFAIPDVLISMKVHELDQRNWNELWEKAFDPIVVEGCVNIRAPFHPPLTNGLPEVVIQPQMSFGTGHHPTTYLMVEALYRSDLKGKSVLDMGTGTGVLAILAKQHGSAKTLAVDIDKWSVDNARENAALNKVSGIQVLEGEMDQVAGSTFDVIFANINRNILVRQMPGYNDALRKGGTVYLSGFYRSDIENLERVARSLGWTLKTQKERDTWCMLQYVKD